MREGEREGEGGGGEGREGEREREGEGGGKERGGRGGRGEGGGREGGGREGEVGVKYLNQSITNLIYMYMCYMSCEGR